jgi:2-phospho-L-lactate guanylyltransferase
MPVLAGSSAMSSSPAPRSFVVLVPVKPPALGKSRLADLPADLRAALASAFARDTVAAARSAERVAEVMVVTDDAAFASVAAADGCATLPDGVTGDLNASLVQAALEAARRWPELAVAAVCADLPSLTSGDLDAALAQVPEEGAVIVADAQGTGTTAYAASSVAAFDPRFGPGSRSAHLAAGAREVVGGLGTLRHDVDDAGDLGRAMVLGVGRHTAAAMGHGG